MSRKIVGILVIICGLYILYKVAYIANDLKDYDADRLQYVQVSALDEDAQSVVDTYNETVDIMHVAYQSLRLLTFGYGLLGIIIVIEGIIIFRRGILNEEISKDSN